MRQGLHSLIPWLWAAVWFTLPVSMRANAFSLILFGMAVMAMAVYRRPVFHRQQAILAGLFILLFAWYVITALLDPDRHDTWKSLERKLSLAVIPVIMLLAGGNLKDPGKWALRGLFAGLSLSGAWLLAVALVKVVSGQPLQSFTYHEFTSPIGFSAIYFSCFLSAGIFFLAFRTAEGLIERFKVWLTLFFIILLLLCASKLFIVLTIPPLIWTFTKKYAPKQGRMKYLVPLTAILLVLAGSVPFFNRVSELKNTDFQVVTRDEYAYDTPLNGVTLRMILWRFAGGIMNEENAWLTGTGITSKQEILNGYYLRYGIYTGNPDLGDKGYLDYNFHDQYLETLVGTGIPGLILLLSVIFFRFIALPGKQFFPLVVYITTTLFLLTESMLERQAGIVFFCLMWTLSIPIQNKNFINHGKNNNNHPERGELA